MPSAGVRTWVQVDKAQTVKTYQEISQAQQLSNQSVRTQAERDDDELLAYVRSKVIARGARGINGLRRVFKIMDDDNSKSLSRAEFVKAMQDYRITSDLNEANRIFNLFDRDHSNTLDYDEFLRAVVGEMNDRRKALVAQAYKKFDRDGNGVVNIEDLKGVYNAAHHPEVRAGRKTEEDVLYEFLDTFEQYYSLIVRRNYS